MWIVPRPDENDEDGHRAALDGENTRCCCGLAVEPVTDKETGLELNEENVEKVLDEIRPYLAGTGGGGLQFLMIKGPIVKVRLRSPVAVVRTV
ncbi:hypothetical protein ABZP36_034586 [Zizania latifolia]